MDDKQKERALALYRCERVRLRLGDIHVRYVRAQEFPGGPFWQIPVPNLAESTGAVEGRLHRILEALVGGLVAVSPCILPSGTTGWHCWPVGDSQSGWHPEPTRTEAIVTAILNVAGAKE